MSFLDKLKLGKKEKILVIGGDEALTEKQKTAPSQLFLGISLGFLIVAVLFSYGSTADLIADKEFQLRGYFEKVKQKKTEQENLKSLQLLSSQVDTIREDFKTIDKSIPSDPQVENIISFLEFTIQNIRKKYFLELPEAISWSYVSPNDISNNDIASVVEVYEYRISLTGDYKAFLEFFKAIQNHLRLMDVRSVRGMSLTEDGMFSADLVIWAYNIPTLF